MWFCPAIRHQSKTLEDVQMADLVSRKDESSQGNALLSSNCDSSHQICLDYRSSAFLVSIVYVAERMRPDFMADACPANPLQDIRRIPGRIRIDGRAGGKAIPIAREPAIVCMEEQIRMRVGVAIAHAPLEHEMADHRPGRRDVVLVEECQEWRDVFTLLPRLVLECGNGKAVESSPRQFQIETHPIVPCLRVVIEKRLREKTPALLARLLQCHADRTKGLGGV